MSGAGLVRLLKYEGKRFWVAQGIEIKVNVQLGPVKMLIMQQIYVKNLADRGIAKPRKVPVGKEVFIIVNGIQKPN